MTEFPERVRAAIERDYEFNFGEYIGQGIEIVRNNLLLFAAFTFVLIVISSIIGYIPYLGGLVSTIILTPCLGVGYLIAAKQTHEGKAVEFSDFFKGFDHINELAIVGFIGWIPTFLIQVSIFGFSTALMGADSFSALQSLNFGITTILFCIPVLYLTIAWSMAGYLVVFFGMKAWPAMEASRQIITKKWFHFFFLGLVLALIASLGMIAFLIGIFFTVAVIPCAQYASFRDIVGVAEDDAPEIDIMSHLVD